MENKIFYQHGIAKNKQRFTVAIAYKDNMLTAYVTICNPQDTFTKKAGRESIDLFVAQNQFARQFKLNDTLTDSEIRTEMSIHLHYMTMKVANNINTFKRINF